MPGLSHLSAEIAAQEVKRRFLWRFAKAIKDRTPVGGGGSKLPNALSKMQKASQKRFAASISALTRSAAQQLHSMATAAGFWSQVPNAEAFCASTGHSGLVAILAPTLRRSVSKERSQLAALELALFSKLFKRLS